MFSSLSFLFKSKQNQLAWCKWSVCALIFKFNFFSRRNRIADVFWTSQKNLLTWYQRGIIPQLYRLPLLGWLSRRCRSFLLSSRGGSSHSRFAKGFGNWLGSTRNRIVGVSTLNALDVDKSNRSTRTRLVACATKHTSLWIDVGYVIDHMHSITSASSLALLASNARTGTCLHRHRTLVFVHTGYRIGFLGVSTHLSHLNNVARTSLLTCTTSGTLLCIHLWQSCFRIHVDSIKLTGIHTVTTPQTAVGTCRLTHTCGMSHTTTLHTVVSQYTRTSFTCPIASNNSKFGSSRSHLHAKNACN